MAPAPMTVVAGLLTIGLFLPGGGFFGIGPVVAGGLLVLGLVVSPQLRDVDRRVLGIGVVFALWLAGAALRMGPLGIDLRLAAGAAAFLGAFACGARQRLPVSVVRAVAVVLSLVALGGTLIGLEGTYLAAGELRRATGLLPTPAALAGVLAMALPWLLTDEAPASDAGRRLGLLLVSAGLGVTGSRAGLLAAVVAVAIVRPPRRGDVGAVGAGALLGLLCTTAAVLPTLVPAAAVAGLLLAARSRAATHLTAGAAVVAGLVTVAWIRPEGVVTRLVDTRSAIWEVGLREWLSAPLVGVGSGQVRMVASDEVYATAYLHSDLLEVLATSGLLGLLLAAGVAAVLVRRARRLPDARTALGVLGALGVIAALDLVLHVPAVAAAAGWLTATSQKEQS